MKKIVITNVFGPLNKGDYELFDVLIKLIKKNGSSDLKLSGIARDKDICTSVFPEVDFYEQPGKNIKTNKKTQYLISSIYLLVSLLGCYFSLLWKLLPKSQREGLYALKEADVVIACPGGYIEDSSPSFFPQLCQWYIAILLNKKLYLAPQSIGPASGKIKRFLLKKPLKRASEIYVRETYSQSFCDELGVKSKLSKDLAFEHYELIERKNSREAGDYFCVTIICWSFPEARDKGKAKESYLNAIMDSCIYYAGKGLKPILIVQVDNDKKDIFLVASRLKEAKVVFEIIESLESPEQVRELFSGAKFVIASRFHSAIFSMQVNTPVVPISYLPKTEYMMSDMGLTGYYLSIYDIDSHKIKNKVESSLESGYSHKMESCLSKLPSTFTKDLASLLS